MLSLRVCFGCDVLPCNANQPRCIPAYTKLGGVHVGVLTLRAQPSKANLVGMLKDLQQQAATLLKHTTRPKEYMTISIDGCELPSLTYRDTLWPSEAAGAVACLSNVFDQPSQNHKAFLLWDEDDTTALICATSHHDAVYTKASQTLELNAFVHIWPQIRVFEYAYAPTTIIVTCWLPYGHHLNFTYCVGVRIDFLAHFKHVSQLCIRRGDITDWSWATKLGIKKLNLAQSKFVGPCTEHLSKLESLTLKYDDMGPWISCLPSLRQLRVHLSPKCESKQSIVNQLRELYPHLDVQLFTSMSSVFGEF